MPAHVDIETYSEVNLKKVGIYRYAEHESTEIQVVCYCFDDGPVHCWVPKEKIPRAIVRGVKKRMDEGAKLYVQPEPPEDLEEYASSGGEMRAHNSQFERVMLNSHSGKQINFPETTIEQWVCTAAKAAAHSLPRALENCADVLGTRGKDKVGKQDMLALCKPRTGKIKRYTPENAPDRYISMYAYCIDDVHAEYGIDKAIPDLPPSEIKLFELDQEINDRGVYVDLPAVGDVQILIAEHKAELEHKCRQWTGLNPTQTEKLSNWIREEGGYEIEDLQAATMKEAMKDPKCPPNVRRVLAVRMLHSMKAISKYDAIERAITEDQRLHGMFLYHGASTGRWSSLIVQLQNLFRPVIKDPDIAIEAFATWDLDWIRTLYPEQPMKVFASCVRGMLVAAPGFDILARDYAAIDARVLAWLAGQTDILEVFEGHGKVYEHTAAKVFHLPDDEASLRAMKDTHPDERFVGKVCVLALGYQGGKKAFAKMAKNYGVDFPENRAEKVKQDWRTANPKIADPHNGLWKQLQDLAKAAVKDPGRIYALPNKKIMFKQEDDFLYMRLPSGRRLAYFKPRVNSDDELTYMGIDTYTRRWMRCKTYGGKLTENAVQAIARDLLAFAMLNLRKAGYPIIGTVHDEIIMEVLKSFGSEEEVDEIMCTIPSWAEGLPVAAEGFRERRYRK